MAKVFAIANQKGGVGKTTTCINLAASLVATKRRVLLIDLDPQGNATMGSGVDKHGLENSVYDLLIGECDLAQAMHYSEHGGYQLLPANRDLTAAEVVLLEMQMKESRLRSALAPIRENYDYILIDCPPSLSMLTLNALVAADGVIIPMQCEYFALEGLSDLVDNIKRIAELLNPNLKVEGLLRTMYDPRLSLMNDVSAQLKEHFGEQLYDTVIPRNIRPGRSTKLRHAGAGVRQIIARRRCLSGTGRAKWSVVNAKTHASPLPSQLKESPWPSRNEVSDVDWMHC
jgi:chromosome partitioning protein